jgi:hypothetical protein
MSGASLIDQDFNTPKDPKGGPHYPRSPRIRARRGRLEDCFKLGLPQHGKTQELHAFSSLSPLQRQRLLGFYPLATASLTVRYFNNKDAKDESPPYSAASEELDRSGTELSEILDDVKQGQGSQRETAGRNKGWISDSG